jgi:hypothetical protein
VDVARFGSDRQAGTESFELGVSDDTAPVQLGQLPKRLGGVRRRLGRDTRGGPLGLRRCRRESRTNRMLGPAPALTPSEPRIEVVGTSRDGDVADHLAEKGHCGDSTARRAGTHRFVPVNDPANPDAWTSSLIPRSSGTMCLCCPMPVFTWAETPSVAMSSTGCCAHLLPSLMLRRRSALNV